MTDCRTALSYFAGIIAHLMRDRSGAVAIEYGLLVAMIAIALVGILSMSGVVEHQADNYNLLSNAMNP